MISFFLNFISAVPKVARAFISACMIALIGMLDFVTGSEISVSVLYTIPVILIGWFERLSYVVVMSFLVVVVWKYIDAVSLPNQGNIFIHFWNFTVRFSVFLLLGYSFNKIKFLLDRERELSRVDSLTGVSNSRNFYELGQVELARSSRYDRPLALAFIDLDNFKYMNDKYGHSVGDSLLRDVAGIMKKSLRSTDIIARLGGDEFVIMMPDTDSENASVAIEKVRKNILKEMNEKKWPVTMSIGLISCPLVRCTLDELIKLADSKMYLAKEGGKNRIVFVTHDGRTEVI